MLPLVDIRRGLSTVHTLGAALRDLRRRRGLSQERVATRAHVTTRALRYREADQQQPRDVEMESVLKALEATAQERAHIYALLPDRRHLRLARSAEAGGSVPTALLGPTPGLGDLLRAMRLRRGGTQEQLAEQMRISRSTVIRWEATRMLPSEADM